MVTQRCVLYSFQPKCFALVKNVHMWDIIDISFENHCFSQYGQQSLVCIVKYFLLLPHNECHCYDNNCR